MAGVSPVSNTTFEGPEYAELTIYDKLGLFRFPKRHLMDWRNAMGEFFLRGGNLPLILLNGHKNDRGVVGTCIANDTMLRRSDQLLLTPENDHFEGSMLLKAKESIMSRY